MAPDDLLAELERRAREEALLGSIAATLEWDEETHMPEGGLENRSRQQALLAGLLHDRAVDPRVGELCDALAASSLCADADSAAAVTVRELKKGYERERKLPRALATELAAATTVAAGEWVHARAARDFGRFAPHLERVLALKRQEAACLSGGGAPYDALLDDHEEGMSVARLEPIFAELCAALPPLVEQARGAPGAGRLGGAFDLDAQRAVGERVAAACGFDFARGRLDASVHPFTIGLGPGDCRITARWEPDDLAGGLFAVLHEVGHGLYEQGLDAEQWGLPLGEQVSHGIDEGQARLWENLVGKSPGFWRWLWPQLGAAFAALEAGSVDAAHRAVNRVAATPIRATADEVTYNLHIAVRFELERALIAGDLEAAGVPEAWDGLMRDVLGVAPRHAAEGCLQDGHWADGLIGYFPSYTLGDIYAAQLFAAAARDLGDLDAAFARGELHPLRDWLAARVYRHGCRHPAAELVERATGSPPEPTALLDRLRAKVAWLSHR